MSGQIGSLGSDLRFAARMFLKTPGLTLVMLLSLALGIGANTAVFSLVNAVMLRLLPVRNPEQLYFLTDAPKAAPAGESLTKVATPYFGYKEYELIRDSAGTFSGVAAFRNINRLSAGYNGRAGIAQGQLVSGNYFSLLGVSPLLGRAFDETEDGAPGADPLAVIGYQFWQREFGADRSIIGQTLNLNNTPFTIIGVMPSGFFGLEPGVMPDIWVPASMKERVTTGRDPGTEIVARLAPGAGEAQAQAEMDVIFARILEERVAAARPGTLSPEGRDEVLGRVVKLSPGARGIRGLRDEIGDPVLVMMIIVALVLLIACANVATLILVKATRRRKEFAVRIALGASRGRLLRQLMAESVFLTAIGGLLGILLAGWGVGSLLNLLATGPNPVRLSISPDGRVIAYTAAILGLTLLIFGMVPALRATGVDVAPALKESSSGIIGGKNRIGASRILVVIQVALSLLLLVGAGLFVRTLTNLKSLEVGFEPESVLIATVDPTLVGYKGARTVTLYNEIESRIRQLNGVRSASVSAFSPLGQLRGIAMVSVPGYVPQQDEEPVVSLNRVGADYFGTLGIPLLRGRGIERTDGESSPKVAVINEALANRFFRDQDPLGKVVDLRLLGSTRQVEIVGLVKDSKYSKVQEEISPTIYTPFVQSADAGRMTFIVRAESDPKRLVPDIRAIISAIDGNVPLFDVKTVEEQIDESLVQERLTARLSGFFGLLALLLACIGLFGVTSYEVAQRTNEIGIRMALGATPGKVLWGVVRGSLFMVLVGIAIGLGAAFFVTPLISKLLFGLAANDPLTFGAAAAVMACAAILASYIPARRAARIDPIIAIRYE
ncbi:MAG TPA: ABC transporter permease [Blastocatellia bacterium]|nr:ABC transporter permease [Blastocatellia bacterium]